MSSSSYSYSRVDGSVISGVTSVDSGSQGRLYPRKKNDLKHNQPSSTYVPHNRMSRYATALVNLVPIRFKRVPGSELPLDKIGLFSSVSFNWLNEYLSAGFKNGAKDKPLPTIAKLDSCQVNGSRIDGLWHDHVVKCGQAGASVPRIAWHFVRTRVLVAAFIYFLGMIISLCSPIIVLQHIIAATEERMATYAVQINNTFNNNNTLGSNATEISSSNNTAANNVTSINATNNSLAGISIKSLPDTLRHLIIVDEVIIFSNISVLIAAEVISYFLIAWSASLNLRTATRLRSACLALAYKKLIRSSIRYKASAHQTMTYFIPNSKTLYELISNGPLIFSGPLILLLCALFIWYSLGHWALIGIVVLMFLYSCLILTAYLAKMFGTRAMEYSLQRMSLMQEFIDNMFLAKVTLWDSYFVEKIQDVREKELAEMRMGGLSEGWSLSMVHIIPVVTVSATTMACMLTNKHIISANFIPVLVLILINLKHCIRSSWLAMSSISRGVTSLNKLKTVLTLKDSDRFTDKPIDKNLAVTINHGNFTWQQDKAIPDKSAKRTSQFYVENSENIPVRIATLSPVDSLVELNFYAPKEKLIGICGAPGSGKTSLLLSLMGHLNNINGHVTMDGTCAYVRQEPWLFDGTLKENILFGESLDATWYYKTIQACHLSDDIARLPGSDDTDLSLISLDVALKQKITLARAVYTQRDINLLDNPLSYIEPEEGKEIFEKSIIHALGTKTVIMISDRVQFLNRCDTIYVMREGKIVEQGTHEELLQWKGEYTLLLDLYVKKYKRKYCRPGDQMNTSMTQLLTTPGPRGILSSTSTAASSGSILQIDNNSITVEENCDIESPIKHSIYDGGLKIKNNFYMKNCGGWSLGITMFIISACFSFPIAISPLIFMYIAQKTITDKTQIVVILASVMGFVIFWGAILLVIYNKMVFTAASKLHEKWMQGLYRAKMTLFTTISSSMLLNICSLNLQEVDSVLPRLITTVVMHTGISIFSVIILGILSPWLLIPTALFVTASIFYSVYARGLTLSLYETTQADTVVPIYNHAVNTIEGRAVIQAYHKDREFTKKFYKYCDNHSAFDFMLDAIKLWIEYRIKMMSALTLGVTILICASLNNVRDRFEILGLAFICTLQLALSIVHLIGAITSAYTSLLAIGTLDDYIENIPKEKIGRDDVPEDWPNEGCVKFDNVVLLENSEMEPLSITIAPGEKVALVGTQATLKTTFVTAIYRFVEINSGNVFIDNTNIADMQIDKLRRSMNFIPGDPVLFDGSLRYNLDPMRKKTNEVLMIALQKVSLWEKVSRLPKKLDSPASTLFNVWEKKLLFLARALLKSPCKILIIEESVENLGSEEDFFGKILRDVFADYTIIALSSHKVRYAQRSYCLDEGKVTEVSNRKSDLSQASIVVSDVLLTVPKNMIETNF